MCSSSWPVVEHLAASVATLQISCTSTERLDVGELAIPFDRRHGNHLVASLDDLRVIARFRPERDHARLPLRLLLVRRITGCSARRRVFLWQHRRRRGDRGSSRPSGQQRGRSGEHLVLLLLVVGLGNQLIVEKALPVRELLADHGLAVCLAISAAGKKEQLLKNSPFSPPPLYSTRSGGRGLGALPQVHRKRPPPSSWGTPPGQAPRDVSRGGRAGARAALRNHEG